MEWLLFIGIIAFIYACWRFFCRVILGLQSADLFRKIRFDLPPGFVAERRSDSRIEIRNPRYPYQMEFILTAEVIPGHTPEGIAKGICTRVNAFFASQGVSVQQIVGLSEANPKEANNWVRLGAAKTKKNEIIQMYYFARNNAVISLSLRCSAEYAELGATLLDQIADSVVPNTPHNVIDLRAASFARP